MTPSEQNVYIVSLEKILKENVIKKIPSVLSNESLANKGFK